MSIGARRLRRPAAALAALLVFLLGFQGVPSARATTEASAGSGVTLKVDWFAQPGYMQVESDGQPSGYLYEYLQTIAQQTGWKYTFVQGDELSLRYQLRMGRIDLLAPVFVDDSHTDQMLLSDLAAGVQTTTLYTRVGGSLGENDYASFNNIRVGIMQGTAAETALLDLSLNKGFTPRLVYYSSESAIRDAVLTGIVDAGVTSCYQRQDNFRPLARFAPRNFNFAVSKNKPDIIRVLNDAMAEIINGDQYFNERLAEKYQFSSMDLLTLTKAERDYCNAHPTLTVAYGKAWEPLLQIDPGRGPTGVAVLVLQNLAALIGVTLDFVPLETATRYDILCCMPQDFDLASTTGVTLSNAFLTLPMALVSLDGRSSSDSAAVSEGFRINTAMASMPARLTYLAGARDCLDAVIGGSQEAALLNTYIADNLLRNKRYEGLISHRLEGATVSACFAVPLGSAAQLLTILNKYVSHISTSSLNDYIISTIVDNQSINLGAIADQMPRDVVLVSLIAAGLLLALLGTLALLVWRNRKDRARAAEIAAFLEYATKANDDVWELDVVSKQRWRYRIAGRKVIRTPMPPFSEELLQTYVHPDDIAMVRTRVDAMLSEAFIQTRRQERFECRTLYPDGHRWSRVVFQSMLQSRAHPHSMMVYLMDVDNAVRSEEQKNAQLKDALEKAESASNAKSEFTAYISHEIRSPLNAVLGYLAIAKASVNDPQRLTDCFVKSEYAANHLLQLIGDVLDMGSITSGKLKVALNSFDLRLLMDTLASIYGAQAKNRGILYSVLADDLPERYLIGDDLRIKQVIVNLLSNAMKFTGKGGSVTLSVQERPAAEGAVTVRFQVSDTGIGMSEAFQRNLFNAYMQQDASIAGRFGGSGLGLSIAKKLLDLMGGTIAVQSAPGKGTAFIVELTLSVDEQKKNLLVVQPDSRLYFAGKRVLLVEDNDMNMEIATELLKQEGNFEIDTAVNGREAVQKFNASPAGWYDAILMDVRMPEMNGYEATRAIRAGTHPDAATVPILAMTADAFAEDIRQAQEAGMNGHITKPIDIHHVLSALAAVIPET